MMGTRTEAILAYIRENPGSTARQIADGIGNGLACGRVHAIAERMIPYGLVRKESRLYTTAQAVDVWFPVEVSE